MTKIRSFLATLTPVIALASANPAGAGEQRPALALSVVEHHDRIELELIADSPVEQHVDYTIELVGASRAKHSGSTHLEADTRHILSRLNAGYEESWCARVDVREASGQSYTLTAGDCEL